MLWKCYYYYYFYIALYRPYSPIPYTLHITHWWKRCVHDVSEPVRDGLRVLCFRFILHIFVLTSEKFLMHSMACVRSIYMRTSTKCGTRPLAHFSRKPKIIILFHSFFAMDSLMFHIYGFALITIYTYCLCAVAVMAVTRAMAATLLSGKLKCNSILYCPEGLAFNI